MISGTEQTLADLGDRVLSANAYLGADGIVAALDQGAQIVITGRVGDAALFLAPLAHRWTWQPDDLDRIAAGTLVGHLLECAGQLTGGYFADGVRKIVPDLATLGFPYADVDADGTAVIGKPEDTGGLLDRRTVLEQLLYEIDDPTRYQTPDVILDLSSVRIAETAAGGVVVDGAQPVGVPDRLKVSVGVRDGWAAHAEISYAGSGCRQRAELAAAIITERWAAIHGYRCGDLVTDLIGYNATRGWWQPPQEPAEIRVRFATRTLDRQQAVTLVDEVEALYTNGPAGGGGVATGLRETVGIVSTLIDRDEIEAQIEVIG